jgi:hypothetical protein
LATRALSTYLTSTAKSVTKVFTAGAEHRLTIHFFDGKFRCHTAVKTSRQLLGRGSFVKIVLPTDPTNQSKTYCIKKEPASRLFFD